MPSYSEQLLQQTGTTALCLQHRHSLRVEGNKFFCPEPVPFMSDYTVGKVSTGVERRQPSLHRRFITT